MSARGALGRQFQTMYHGTTADNAADIDAHGLRPNDLGIVYATPHREVAERYAQTRSEQHPYEEGPALVSFHAHTDNLTTGAREGEFVHWGPVHPKNIRSIEVD